MTAELRRLIAIGFISSLGAPTLYCLYVVASTFKEGRTLDVLLLLTMFASAFVFSLIATETLVVLTLAIARFFRWSSVPVLLMTAAYLLVLTSALAISYGPTHASVFFVLAVANAAIFLIMSRIP